MNRILALTLAVAFVAIEWPSKAAAALCPDDGEVNVAKLGEDSAMALVVHVHSRQRPLPKPSACQSTAAPNVGPLPAGAHPQDGAAVDAPAATVNDKPPPQDSAAPPQPDDSWGDFGLGVIIGQVKEPEGTYLRIITPRHVVVGQAPDAKPEEREVQVANGSAVETWTEASIEIPGELSFPTAAIVDLAVIRVRTTSSDDLTFAGFRAARSVQKGEELNVTRRNETTGGFQFTKGHAGRFESALGRVVEFPVVGGNSGGPVFDRNWKLVGIMGLQAAGVEKFGTFIPSEVVQLFLEAKNIEPNVRTLDELVETCRRQKRERELAALSAANWGNLIGVVRRTPSDFLWRGPPTDLRFGGYVEGSLWNPGPLVGAGLMAGYQATMGYQFDSKPFANDPRDSKTFVELGGEIGGVFYLRYKFVLATTIKWSPSLLLVRKTFDFAFALPAYAAGVRATLDGYGLGVELRGVSPSGNRPDYVESCLYFSWSTL